MMALLRKSMFVLVCAQAMTVFAMTESQPLTINSSSDPLRWGNVITESQPLTTNSSSDPLRWGNVIFTHCGSGSQCGCAACVTVGCLSTLSASFFVLGRPSQVWLVCAVATRSATITNLP